LGNVLVTVSDRKIGQSPVNNLYTSFTADVVSATDYAPFGMQMVGRTFDAAGATAYRYGFNGKENDNEVKGEGNQQDYGMRIYDPRLGKFLSVDPIANNFPDLTPYQFAGNTPIQAIDLDGGEPQGYREYWEARTDEYMTKWGFSVQDVYDYQTRQVWTVMRYPNTNEYYYYATKYESAQRLFVPQNTSLNKNGLEWTGSFKQFQTRSASELGAKSANAMLASFAIGFTAPFAVAGAAFTASFAIEQGTIAAAQGILAYYRYGPAVGAAGKVVAEFLDETGTVSSSGKIRNVIDESRIKHIFRNEVGHFIEDTKEARQAIENVANDASNLLGADKYGSGWYAWVNEKGQQLWAQVRKGQIVNGGVNEVPREFSTEAGLAAKEVPKK
jgi:RHS repeat-associated protein